MKIYFENICEIKTLRYLKVKITSHRQIHTTKKMTKEVLQEGKNEERKERNGNDAKWRYVAIQKIKNLWKWYLLGKILFLLFNSFKNNHLFKMDNAL